MATRLLDQKPQYQLADGTLCAGGSLTFTDTGTTTPRNVYGEPALSTNLGATLTLGSDARTSVDVWLSGSYRVVLKDSAGATVWTQNDTRDTVASTYYAIPNPATGTNGQVIQTNGTVYALATIIQVPDPTGSSGKFLTTDGSVQSWASIQTYSSTSLPGGTLQGATSFQIGKMLTQYGSAQAPTAAATKTTKAVTFATAYASGPLHVSITPRTDNITPAGALCSYSVTSLSTTGFTVTFYAGQEHGAADWFITSAIDFTYSVSGLVA